MRHRDPFKAMRVLETIFRFYGEGDRWTRGVRHDGRGKHCLVGAIELHCKHPGTVNDIIDYIGAAIWPRSDREYSPERLMTFNDRCSGTDRICDEGAGTRAARHGEAAARDCRRAYRPASASADRQPSQRSSTRRSGCTSAVIHAQFALTER